MRTLLFSFLIFPLISVGQDTLVRKNAAGEEERWVLTFGDDFNGDKIDESKWHVVEGIPRDPDQGSNYVWYSKNNVEVHHGLCRLVLKNDTMYDRPFWIWIKDGMKERKGNHTHSSGEIMSKQYFDFGMYEIRCRLPKSKGLNSAFWMYGEKDGVNNEIDVFEYWDVKGPLKMMYNEGRLCKWHNMTVHYNGRMSIEGYLGEDMSEGFHTFTCVWDECKIEWWADGKLRRTLYRYKGMRGIGKVCEDFVKRKNPAKLEETPFPRDPMQIISNVSVKKTPDGPDNPSLFPISMDIDYIRYYKKAGK
jgi:beta-glucanase (GH16 family)